VRPTIANGTAEAVRERLESFEALALAPLAAFSKDAPRPRPEVPCTIRTSFQRDRDRVLHAKSFRRLKHKTQVFIAPAGDHYRTRLTHTLEVTQIARTIGRALRLNEDLIEAIGLAHDLGHTPFGHAGEVALAEVFPGFRHNEQSLRVVDVLERDGRGLNLTDAVRDGILRHSKPRSGITDAVNGRPATLEGEVVKIADGVAYINHDLDDAVRAGLLDEAETPEIVGRVLGRSHGERISTLVRDIVEFSDVSTFPGAIRMSEPVHEAADTLRDFLFERVYTPLNEQANTLRAQHVVRELFAYYCDDVERIPVEYRHGRFDGPSARRVADFVSSMTDRYAVETFQAVFVPRFWST
jgi:dGTPase